MYVSKSINFKKGLLYLCAAHGSGHEISRNICNDKPTSHISVKCFLSKETETIACTLNGLKTVFQFILDMPWIVVQANFIVMGRGKNRFWSERLYSQNKKTHHPCTHVFLAK